MVLCFNGPQSTFVTWSFEFGPLAESYLAANRDSLTFLAEETVVDDGTGYNAVRIADGLREGDCIKLVKLGENSYMWVLDEIAQAEEEAEQKAREFGKKQRLKLDAARLLSKDCGLPFVRAKFPEITFSEAAGSEVRNLHKLIAAYREWAFKLHPNMNFKRLLRTVEKLGAHRAVRNELDSMRTQQWDAIAVKLGGSKQARVISRRRRGDDDDGDDSEESVIFDDDFDSDAETHLGKRSGAEGTGKKRLRRRRDEKYETETEDEGEEEEQVVDDDEEEEPEFDSASESSETELDLSESEDEGEDDEQETAEGEGDGVEDDEAKKAKAQLKAERKAQRELRRLAKRDRILAKLAKRAARRNNMEARKTSDASVETPTQSESRVPDTTDSPIKRVKLTTEGSVDEDRPDDPYSPRPPKVSRTPDELLDDDEDMPSSVVTDTSLRRRRLIADDEEGEEEQQNGQTLYLTEDMTQNDDGETTQTQMSTSTTTSRSRRKLMIEDEDEE